MEHWVTTHGETETLIPVVVHVWNRIRDKIKKTKNKKTTHSHSPGVSPTCRWVFEGEAGFGFGQLVEVVQTYHIWRLKVALGVLVSFPAAAHFIVELGGGQRGQVGRVGARDAHAVLCTKMKSRARKWNEVKKKHRQQLRAKTRSCSVCKTACWDKSSLPFRKCCAPSKHSGESSLSPNDPSSSLTMMSAFSGAAQSRMSQDTTVTWSPHSSKRQFSNLCKYESGQKSD